MRSIPQRAPHLLWLAIVLLPACRSYQKPLTEALVPESHVIVRFATPRAMTVTPRSRKDSVRTCLAVLAKGKVAAIAGDSITLRPVDLAAIVGPADWQCRRSRALRFERTATDKVTVRRFSPARTGVLLILVGLVVAGPIAAGGIPIAAF